MALDLDFTHNGTTLSFTCFSMRDDFGSSSVLAKERRLAKLSHRDSPPVSLVLRPARSVLLWPFTAAAYLRRHETVRSPLALASFSHRGQTICFTWPGYQTPAEAHAPAPAEPQIQSGITHTQ